MRLSRDYEPLVTEERRESMRERSRERDSEVEILRERERERERERKEKKECGIIWAEFLIYGSIMSNVM